MKRALQHTEKRAHPRETVTLGFFFNARGSLLERSPVGLFRSLLHQLLWHVRSLFSILLPTFRKKQQTRSLWEWEWELDELSETLRKVSKWRLAEDQSRSIH